jgi:SPP1 family predicted phage head-tail adaptor
MPVSATIKASIAGSQTSALDLGTAEFPFAAAYVKALADGTAADQANVLFTDTRTLSASATEDLDLAGALANALGGSAVFAKVKAVLVTASAANTNNVNVTRPASNGVPLFLAASDGVAVPPGGAFMLAGPGTAGLCTVTAHVGRLQRGDSRHVGLMDAGRLRHRVELQRVSVALDSHGDSVETWATLAEVWASIEPLSGREFLQASSTTSDVTVRIIVRGRSDIALTPKDRVLYGTRAFDIRHVVDWGGRGVEWHLMCTERF